MKNNDILSMRERCCCALDHLRAGLAMLDAAGAPSDVAAHVDLAICKLEEAIDAVACQLATATQDRLISSK